MRGYQNTKSVTRFVNKEIITIILIIGTKFNNKRMASVQLTRSLTSLTGQLQPRHRLSNRSVLSATTIYTESKVKIVDEENKCDVLRPSDIPRSDVSSNMTFCKPYLL